MKSFQILLVLSVLLTGQPWVAPATGIDVIANDTADAYEITGAVILDESFADSREAATCSNCQWRIIRTCASGPLEDRRNCLGLPCLSASDIAEVWRADAPAPPPIGDPAWLYRGLVCLSGPPSKVSDVSWQIREIAVRSLPLLHPTSQPALTTLTGLPTVFRTRQAAEMLAEPASVAGMSVTIHAVPSWTWDFGHGQPLATADPGAAWPTGRIRHTYPRRGIYRVRVTAVWHATYSVRGITDLPVDGNITQSAWFDLRVREARRFLHKPQGA